MKKGIVKMTNEKFNQENIQETNQASNQANNQANNQMVEQQIQQRNEAKTVVNGKVVPLKEIQVAEELFNQQNTQTGIQAHHDNSSEAVQTGQVAQNQQILSQAMTNLENAKSIINQVNVQSGQQHLEEYMQQAQQEIQSAQEKMSSAARQQSQQTQSRGQQMTQGMPEVLAERMEDSEAIQSSIQQANAKAKARAKKEQ
jgi:hypothetical protein